MLETMTTVNEEVPHPTMAAGPSVAFPSIMVLSALLGLAFVAVVKPGIPYDEPSHWLNVLYVAGHHRIPTIGDRSVSYEAQQPPLAYIVAALMEWPVRTITSLRGAFYAVRITGGVEWLIALVFAWRLLGRLVPDSTMARSVAFAVLALNPMLLAMAWSVQNDSLALLIGFAAIDYASTIGRRSVNGLHGAVLGAIVAAGVLTKLTDWALVVAIPIWWLLVPRGLRPWKAIVAFGGSLAALSGWWFIRNAHLYGDPLGRGKAAAESGGFAPYPLSGLHSLAHAGENVISYLWLPTEYWRNVVHAPGGLKGLLVVTSLVVLVAGPIALVRRTQPRPTEAPASALDESDPTSDAWSLVVIAGVVAFVAWLLLYFGWSALAPRLAYLALPLWMGLVGLATRAAGHLVPRLRPVLPIGTVVVMVGLCAWGLHAVHGVDTPWQFFNRASAAG